ncbi:MAG: ATP-binding SpoIIE family protein phosphatase [Rudaea sp.]
MNAPRNHPSEVLPAAGEHRGTGASRGGGSTHLRIPVEEGSQVAQARREAVALGRQVGLDDNARDRLALVVTEAATNLLKHGGGGVMLVAPLGEGASVGVEVLALDRGPGMRNVAASMRDGHSTAGSPGVGLGTLSRLASDLDIHSRPDAGTVVRFEVWSAAAPSPGTRACFGGVCVAKPGESVSGDAWLVQIAGARQRVMVVDGLGHGPDAAAAARCAVRIALEHPSLEPVPLLEALHAALRSTRGAAIAVAMLEPHASTGRFASIGNVRGVVHTGGEGVRSLVSHNGTVGHQVRKIQSFDFAYPAHALLMLHSDGIDTHWSIAAYPGFERHHPAVIAAAIYRDHTRGRDDATFVVVRNEARERR